MDATYVVHASKFFSVGFPLRTRDVSGERKRKDCHHRTCPADHWAKGQISAQAIIHMMCAGPTPPPAIHRARYWVDGPGYGSGPIGAITSRLDPAAISFGRKKGRELESRRRRRRRRQRRPVAEAAAATASPRDQRRPSIRSGEVDPTRRTGGRPSPAEARLPKVDGKTSLRLLLRVLSVEDAVWSCNESSSVFGWPPRSRKFILTSSM